MISPLIYVIDLGLIRPQKPRLLSRCITNYIESRETRKNNEGKLRLECFELWAVTDWMELKVRNVSMAQFIGDNYPTAISNWWREKTHFGLSPMWNSSSKNRVYVVYTVRTGKWMTLYRASVNLFRSLFCMPILFSLAIFLALYCKTKVLITSCAAKEKKAATNPWNNSLSNENWSDVLIAFKISSSSGNISSNKVRCVITCNRTQNLWEK